MAWAATCLPCPGCCLFLKACIFRIERVWLFKTDKVQPTMLSITATATFILTVKLFFSDILHFFFLWFSVLFLDSEILLDEQYMDFSTLEKKTNCNFLMFFHNILCIGCMFMMFCACFCKTGWEVVTYHYRNCTWKLHSQLSLKSWISVRCFVALLLCGGLLGRKVNPASVTVTGYTAGSCAALGEARHTWSRVLTISQ